MEIMVFPSQKNNPHYGLSACIPFAFIMLFFTVVSTILLKINGNNLTLLDLILNLFIITMSFNVFDLVILDWLIFCFINPRYLIIKETEGMKEYKDYVFHFVKFINGCVYSLSMSIIVESLIYFL